jgi:REP element-mobilizing transposase RayT
MATNRCSIRLRDYDYTQDGVYFVTVCAHNHECMFGEIVGGEMKLNGRGEIVQDCWKAIPQHFEGVELDEYIVTPNHAHGIIVINRWEQMSNAAKNVRIGENTETNDIEKGNVGARHALPLHKKYVPSNEDVPMPVPGKPIARSLGIIVGSFKSAATKHINQERGTSGTTVWQRNYYEHIIRNAESLNSTRLYIQTNPAQWDADSENPVNR